MVVASGVGAERIRQIAPQRSRSQDPEDAVDDAPVIDPRDAARLVRQIGLIAAHSWSVSSQRMIRSSRFWSLNHMAMIDQSGPDLRSAFGTERT